MSNQKHKHARLDRYNGPFFPRGLDDLDQAKTRFGSVNGMDLDDLGKTVRGYKGQTRPKTSDGYSWFWVLHFQLNKPFWFWSVLEFLFGIHGKEIAIAFPWSQDWENTDGTKNDRSLAIYTRGNVNETQMATLLSKLNAKLMEMSPIK